MPDGMLFGHWLQFPPDLSAMGAYLESRGGESADTLFFGLQMILAEMFARPLSAADLEEAAGIWQLHGLPFHRQGWQLSYATKVQGNGNLMVGKAYTAKLGLEPGDEFEIKLSRKQIQLIPLGAEEEE